MRKQALIIMTIRDNQVITNEVILKEGKKKVLYTAETKNLFPALNMSKWNAYRLVDNTIEIKTLGYLDERQIQLLELKKVIN